MRVTAILTNTAPGIVPGQAAGLELRHRQHARVEDRIREAKATGLRNFPCRAWNENNAWLEVVLTAVDLVCWTKLICFADVPELARCEIARVPLPGPARRRPAHPRQPDSSTCASTRPGDGPSNRRRLPPTTHRVRLTTRAPPTTTRTRRTADRRDSRTTATPQPATAPRARQPPFNQPDQHPHERGGLEAAVPAGLDRYRPPRT